jgi:small subunit ribosomal protein S4
VQLIEKQRLRHYYNVSDTQLGRYMKEARAMPGDAKIALHRILETRLDNVVRRLHWASSIWQARQMVSHGHFLVNERKVDRPSYQVRLGDVIAVKPRSADFVRRSAADAANIGLRTPDWLAADSEKLIARVLRMPTPEDLAVPFDVDYTKVIEFYTR